MLLKSLLKPGKKAAWSFYAICDSDESCSLLTWLNNIPKDLHASKNRLLVIIDKAATDRHGPQLLPVEISHTVNDKHSIYEFIAGKLRLLWFYSPTERKVIICTIGFTKKTQKTPRKHIDAAIKAKKAYTKAANDNNIVIVEDKKEMTKHESFADLWAEAEKDEVFWTEKNKIDFAVKLFQTMKRRGIAKKELAERLGTSQAYITKVFRGNANFTLDSMTKLVQALDAKLSIQIVPKEENVRRWYKVLDTAGGGKKTVPSQNWHFKPKVEKEHFSGTGMEACLG